MEYNVPFLSDTDVSDDMELASAFLYFSTVEPEKIMGLFPKQGSEDITYIARGFYPLYGYFLDKEGAYCVYDRLGGSKLELDVEDCISMALDFESLSKLNIDERIKAVRGAITDSKDKSYSKMPVGSLLTSYKNLTDYLMGRGMGTLRSSTVSLEDFVKEDIPDKHQVEILLGKIRGNIDAEVNMFKKLCDFEQDSFNDFIDEKSSIYDSFKARIDEMERKTGKNIGSLFIEREEKIKEARSLYNGREEYLAGDYLLNKNKYDAAQLAGSEIEMDLYKANMSDSEEKINELKKELQDEIKTIGEHYDSYVQEQKNMMDEVINDRDNNISRCQKAYSEFRHAIEDLKDAVKDDIYGKRDQLGEIKSYLLRTNQNLNEESIIINIPFYIAEFKGKNVRYRLLFPLAMKEKSQVKSIITEMAGKVSLPFETRNSLFEDIQERLAGWLVDTQNREAYDLFKVKNLAAFEGMHERVENGLSEMFTQGFMSDKSLDRSLIAVRSIFSNK